MQLEIERILKQNDEIVFGPFVGELGWEIIRFSGFVRWIKKNFEKKRIIVSTRYDRYDLYHNAVDEVDLFKIQDENLNYCSNCYRLVNLPDNMYKLILKGINRKFPRAHIVEINNKGCNREVFSFREMDFNYTPHIDNIKIVQNILKNNLDKIPIVLFPRHREESSSVRARNWGTNNWKTLYDLLERSNKFFVISVGTSPTYYKAKSYYKNIINLEDFLDNRTYCTMIGLTIEMIRNSVLSVGSQSGVIILSNLLKTPTIFWGHEIKRHKQDENLFNTECIGIEDPGYQINPSEVFKIINGLANDIKNKTKK